MEFLAHQLMLSEKQEDGKTYRDHLEALSKRRGITHPDLIGPDLPDAFKYIWNWFCELSSSSDGSLTYREIEAWSRLTGARPTPAEVKLIMAMERKKLGG
jgi:hypothetical protein